MGELHLLMGNSAALVGTGPTSGVGPDVGTTPVEAAVSTGPPNTRGARADAKQKIRRRYRIFKRLYGKWGNVETWDVHGMVYICICP